MIGLPKTKVKPASTLNGSEDAGYVDLIKGTEAAGQYLFSFVTMNTRSVWSKHVAAASPSFSAHQSKETNGWGANTRAFSNSTEPTTPCTGEEAEGDR